MVDTRTKILIASTECIARSGVRGLRVNDVAKEAAVSTALLYYHFEDRAGLLGATLDYINTRASEYSRQSPPTGEAGMTAVAKLLIDEIQDDAEIRKNSVAWNELRSSAVFESVLREPLLRTTATWNNTIAAALATGERGAVDLPPASVLPTAEILTSLVEGLSGRWLSGSITTEHAQSLLGLAVAALSSPQREHGS